MNVVLLLWRSRLRSSWRAAVVLAVLIGLGGSVALTVAAGARRTASANEVILRWSNWAELAADLGPEDPGKIEQAVRSIDGVTGLDLAFGFQPLPSDRGAGFLSIIGSWQDPVAINRPVVISGRPPVGPTEAIVNGRAARSHRLRPGDHIDFLPPNASSSSIVLFDLADRTRSGDLVERFAQGLPVQGNTPTELFTSAKPAEVSQAEAARTVVWLGVGLLAAAIVGTLIHTLIVGVRQRRREYAVLRAIGFTRSQVRTAVLWQSGAIVGLAVAAALPIGVAAGRWLWIAFARGLGVVVDPNVPLLLLTGFALAVIVLTQGAALVPASIARRIPLASTLRSE